MAKNCLPRINAIACPIRALGVLVVLRFFFLPEIPRNSMQKETVRMHAQLSVPKRLRLGVFQEVSFHVSIASRNS